MYLYEDEIRKAALKLIKDSLEDGLPNVGYIEGVMAMLDAITKKEERNEENKGDC